MAFTTKLILPITDEGKSTAMSLTWQLPFVPSPGQVLRVELSQDYYKEYEVEKVVYDVGKQTSAVYFKSQEIRGGITSEFLTALKQKGWNSYTGK